MRISDWSSDVCSSDLRPHHATSRRHVRRLHQTQRLQVPRLVRCCRHNGSGNRTREDDEEVAARLEVQHDRTAKSRLERSRSGVAAATALLIISVTPDSLRGRTWFTYHASCAWGPLAAGTSTACGNYVGRASGRERKWQ